MRYLLDTCTFLWLGQQPSMLSSQAASLIDDPANELFLSDVCVWEVTLKHGSGRLPLPGAPRVWIPEKIRHNQLFTLPLTHPVYYRSGELPRVHADPFDRLLAAHAMEESLTILSPHEPLSQLGASRVW